jgi:hypothetical protein
VGDAALAEEEFPEAEGRIHVITVASTEYVRDVAIVGHLSD